MKNLARFRNPCENRHSREGGNPVVNLPSKKPGFPIGTFGNGGIFGQILTAPFISLVLTGLIWFSSLHSLFADPLNMTISGRINEKVELESYAPFPAIPEAKAFSLSLDEGKSAIETELEGLSTQQAALFTDSTKLPLPGFSSIPAAPYVVQAVPTELILQQDKKQKRGEPYLRFTDWEFAVIDEFNQVCHKQSGQGFPPNPLTWDGTRNSEFILDPDRAYFSYLKLRAPGEPDRTIAGEGVRFLSFIRQNINNTVVRFGERVYQPDQSQFSAEAKIYLDDLAQRLSHLMSFYKDVDPAISWRVILWEPEEKRSLGERRKMTWKNYLEKALGRNMPEDRFSVEPPPDKRSSVSIVFPRSLPPFTDMALRGRATATLDAHMEAMASLVKISEVKDTIVVDMRHDRLFRPGSAYIRDEALPHLTEAMVRIRSAMGGGQKAGTRIRAHDEESRQEQREREELKAKKLLLRSYTQKLPKDEKEKEEDPMLTAARSKVLFMLFAREGLAP